MRKPKFKTRTVLIAEKTHNSLVRHCEKNGLLVQVVADSAIRVFLATTKKGKQ